MEKLKVIDQIEDLDVDRKNNIRMNLKGNRVGWYGLNASGLG
jgi:hypothetical protein